MCEDTKDRLYYKTLTATSMTRRPHKDAGSGPPAWSRNYRGNMREKRSAGARTPEIAAQKCCRVFSSSYTPVSEWKTANGTQPGVGFSVVVGGVLGPLVSQSNQGPFWSSAAGVVAHPLLMSSHGLWLVTMNGHVRGNISRKISHNIRCFLPRPCLVLEVF
jgi:hypothetical protein